MPLRRLTNPTSAAINDYLEQNGPSTLNEIVAHIGPTIPPGEALRTYQAHLRSSHIDRNRPFNASNRDQDELLRAARRNIIMNLLNGLSRKGRIYRNTTAKTFSINGAIAYETIQRLRAQLTKELIATDHQPECPWFPAHTTWAACDHPDHQRERGT